MERKISPQQQNNKNDRADLAHRVENRPGNNDHFYLQDHRPQSVLQKKQGGGVDHNSIPASANVNNSNKLGLPLQLKTGIEGLSGISMDDVKVHYNSGKPAQFKALAYAQGTSIHLGPGQEKHLPHEAWHVAQQKQGRVKPTLQMKGMANVNDDSGLEKEADIMGAKALQQTVNVPAGDSPRNKPLYSKASSNIIQYVIGPGGMLHSGRRVKGPGNVVYRIVGTEQFLGKLNYRLKDEDGNELIRPFDDPQFNLMGLYEQVSRTPKPDDRDSVLHSESDDEEDLDSDEEGSNAQLTEDDYLSDDEEELSDKDEDNGEQLHESGADDEMDKEVPYTPKTWTIESVQKRLAESSEDTPLPLKEIDDIEHALPALITTKVDRKVSKKIREDVIKAKNDLAAYEELLSSKAPKGRTKRKKSGDDDKSTKKPPSTFDNEADSESSDEEYDPDERLRKYRLSMSAVANRSHVYGIDEADREFRDLVTGLPHADTYLALFKNGQLVPRNINGTTNTLGHRKRMRQVEAKIKPLLDKRNKLFLELDELNKKIRNKKDANLRDEKIQELRGFLADQIRPHVEAIVFGSSLRPTDEDIEEANKISKDKISIKKGLVDGSSSAAAELFKKHAPGNISKGVDSHTHAEQALIGTQTWINLIDKLTAEINASENKPDKLSKLSFNTLQLVLNRSTCIGCARELTVELIRFWKIVAKLTDKTDWREAKQQYEGYVNFLLDFPAIYEVDKEKKYNYVNISRIILGLRDAGWAVRVITGIKTGTKSDSKNEKMRTLAESVSSTRMFYVKDWDPKIACFVPPESLKGLNKVLVNGIVYILTKDGQYLSTTGEKQTVSKVDAYTFLPTGMPNVLKGKRRIPDGGDPGDSSDSSSSDHSSDEEEGSSSEDRSSDFDEEEEDNASEHDNDEFDTGRIMHEQNTCYLSAIIHLFASNARFTNLFRPGRQIPLEDGPVGNLLIRQADRKKGRAIQMASRIGEAVLELRNPRGVVTKKVMSDIMTFLGLIGDIIDAHAPAAKTLTPKPKELDAKASEISAEMLEKEKIVKAGKSIETSKSLRRDKVKPLLIFSKKSRPASWGVQQDAAEVLIKILSYLQPGNDLKIHMQSKLGRNHEAGFGGSKTNIRESTLQLPIGRDIHTMQDALTNFSSVEQITDYKHGGGNITVPKQVRFTNLPTVLTIVLKRFGFNGDGLGQKITKPIVAPTLLTIPAACLAGDLKNQVIRYRLVHFVEHSGVYGGGHYLSHVKNMDDKWHKHDDIGGKRTMHDEDSFETAKNQSYVYVYERVNSFYRE
ncbi:eCIS core domain-containing protein [Mucilaginibacter terrigena]|uniref:eCIS core domain-containing protein n=1 Tax=Mucilaginibacter terrigena TaxID=2492395 RepID=UPI0013968482|nr:DUF4157 domain-containing protein [Mucilaginibacter terrigena]